MSQSHDKDAGILTEADRMLLAAYRDQSADEPPEAVDDALRAAARRAVGARPRPAGRFLFGAWNMPLAAAATVMLSATIVFMSVREQGLERLSQPASEQAAEAPSTRPPAAQEPASRAAASQAPALQASAPQAPTLQAPESHASVSQPSAPPPTASMESATLSPAGAPDQVSSPAPVQAAAALPSAEPRARPSPMPAGDVGDAAPMAALPPAALETQDEAASAFPAEEATARARKSAAAEAEVLREARVEAKPRAPVAAASERASAHRDQAAAPAPAVDALPGGPGSTSGTVAGRMAGSLSEDDSRNAPSALAKPDEKTALRAQIERIRRMLREGQRAQAIESVKLLRRQYPEQVLPPDLSALLPQAGPTPR